MEEKKNAEFAEKSLGAEVASSAAMSNTATPDNKAEKAAEKVGARKASSKKGGKSASAKSGAKGAGGGAKSAASKSGDKKAASGSTKGGAKPSAKKGASNSTKGKISPNEDSAMSSKNNMNAQLGESTADKPSESADDGFVTADIAIFTAIEEFDEADALAIEREAIAALPMAEVEPELLLCDTGEIEDTRESAEEAARYEEYLKDYKEVMAEMLRSAKAASEVAAEDSDKAELSESDSSEVCPKESIGENEDGSHNNNEGSLSDNCGENIEKGELNGEDDSLNGEGKAPENADGEADGEPNQGEEVAERDESFDPLSTISLLEYIPSLLGQDSANEQAPAESEEASEDADETEIAEESEISEDDESSEEYSEELDEYGETEEPEQLTMSFGGDGEGEELPDKNVYNKEKPRGIDSFFDLIELFVLTFAAIMVITTFFFRHSVIDGRSMQNTLDDGDVVIISNFLYTPERGDIVVLDDRNASDEVLIKRVIAIEGDRISIKADGRVFLNGKLLKEDYVYESNKYHIYKEQEWVLGEGEIFVLGDHRDISEDSEDFGPVKADSVLGKVLFRILPFDSFGGLD